MTLTDLSSQELEEYNILVSQMYDTYERQMLAIDYSILKRKQDAEDAVHDTFVKVINHADELVFDKELSMKAYLMTAVKNTALDKLREGKREIATEEITEEFDINDQKLYENSDTSIMAEILTELPEDDIRLITLYIKYGYSLKEIATIMNISYEAVRQRHHRIKERLKQQFNKD